MDISEVISFQLSDGSWTDCRLIDRLLGTKIMKSIPK
jgi:hypothetical protein